MRTRALALLALFSLAGCDAPRAIDGDGEVVRAVVASAITHGEIDEADAATVALLDEKGNVYCTGVLVSEYVVATAAHCLADAPPKQVFFGNDPKSDDETFIDVTTTRVHADFDRDELTNDIALLGLAKRAPAKPARIVDSESIDESWVGRPIRVVGFGLTKGNGADTGPKRYGRSEISSVDDGTFRFKGAPSQTCNGDSGGPAFAKIGGKDVLVGITSSGDAKCASYGRDTRVDLHTDFIAGFSEPYDARKGVPSAGCSVARGAGACAPAWIGLALGVAVLARRRRS